MSFLDSKEVIFLRKRVIGLEQEVIDLRKLAYEQQGRGDRAVDRLLAQRGVAPVTPAPLPVPGMKEALDELTKTGESPFEEMSQKEWEAEEEKEKSGRN